MQNELWLTPEALEEVKKTLLKRAKQIKDVRLAAELEELAKADTNGKSEIVINLLPF